MEKVARLLYVIELENGEIHIISTDKRQMARWYAMDYLRDKPRMTDKGYTGVVADGVRFTPAFRKQK